MGTLINVGAIILGGLIGLFSGSRFPKRMQETLIGAVGVSTMFLGISGAMEGLLKIENGSITTQQIVDQCSDVRNRHIIVSIYITKNTIMINETYFII